MAACVVTNLGFLGFFKYYMFAAETLNHLLALVGAEPFRVLRVVLPIGISFYTFHSLTYIIDLYRGHATPGQVVHRLLGLRGAVPGPGGRADHPLQDAGRPACLPRAHRAAVRLGRGHLRPRALPRRSCWPTRAATWPTPSSTPPHPCALDAWFGVLAYAFQIYFDFCGYSDMAVGLGRMLGFEFLKNFDAPYLAESITDFWRRWHISLSSVLRDYLYFPLGGNRKGEARTYVNLAVVMLLGGLWHGAKWNFVVWGAYHGCCWPTSAGGASRASTARLPRPCASASPSC